MFEILAALPFWFSGPQVRALGLACQAFWDWVESWLYQAVQQADIRNCSEAALMLHAADRGLVPFPNEDPWLFRQRVLHAFTTGAQAGSIVGLNAILTAFGARNFSILERQPGMDWDQVLVVLDPDELSVDSGVLTRIFQKWGRLCRRYVFSLRPQTPFYLTNVVVDELQHVEYVTH